MVAFTMNKAISDSLDVTLNERGKTHGAFADHARITQRLKLIAQEEYRFRAKRGQDPLSFKQLEAIDMILHKLGRVIAGESGFADHWLDIAGYASLINKDV